MNAVSSISSSGMNAAQNSLQASAHNLANVDTPDFKRQQSLQTEVAGGGVRAELGQDDVPGNALETDVVTELQAQNSVMANAAVFKTQDRMAGALLDVQA